MDLSKYIINAVHGAKDAVKFRRATKLISRGVPGSSSHAYSRHPQANTGEYSKEDIVGISVNGKRRNRIPPDFREILKAHQAGVKGFITDNVKDRNRPYNIGEREVAAFLKKLGYVEYKGKGLWITKERMKQLKQRQKR